MFRFFSSGGHHRLNQDNRGTIINVAQIISHEGFNMGHLRNDIALLRLATPVQFSRSINTVCLPTQGHRVSLTKTCYISGRKTLVQILVCRLNPSKNLNKKLSFLLFLSALQNELQNRQLRI